MMQVVSFTKDETDLDARVNFKKLDFNGETSALIKIETTKKGFSFDAGQIGVVDVDNNQVAEVWVYIPRGAIKLKIKHQEYGVINYEFPTSINAATVYNMVLSITDTPSSNNKNLIQNQYFILSM